MFGRTLVWLLCYYFLSILPAAAQQRAIRPVDQIPNPASSELTKFIDFLDKQSSGVLL